jgi:arylamine N-acetyltransferase
MKTKNEVLVENFINFLKVEKQEPSLPFLNQLIKSHQLRVKWETLTKIIDWEKGNQTPDFLPQIDIYIDRMTRLGTGGTCWTHAVGFHWLLSQLGFQLQVYHYLGYNQRIVIKHPKVILNGYSLYLMSSD